jgi:cell division transport system permease protein
VRWRFVFSEMAIGLRRNLSMTIATILTIWIALTGLGAAWLMHEQTNATKDYWFGKIQISVFLTKDVSQTERDAIFSQLNNLPQVDHVFYESKAEAYLHFKQQFKNVPALVKNTDPSALPESYRVKLKDPKKFPIVASAVQDMPGVDQVAAEAQALKKVFRLLGGLQNVMLIVAAAVLLASILLIFNNVRLAAFSRRRETGIMRLVGASDLYIQAPFILEITAAAFIGGILASGAMFVIKALIVDHGLRSAFGGILTYIGWGTVWATVPWLILAGVLIAAVTAFGTLQRYLRV